MNRTLKTIPFDGLNTDCLGNYLAGVGVLAAIAQRWPNMRACWRANRFVLLSDDDTVGVEAIKEYLLNDWHPTAYERTWSTVQKADTKAKASTGIWRERSEGSIADARLLDAHIVGTGRNRFNPVLGTGGNVGKRDLAKACKDAVKLLAKPEKSRWLDATLSGQPDVSLPDLSNGGTWFVYANKTFNSGQAWFREGQLSPWSVLFATEGAFMLVGGVNRRLGSRARPYAVFPFVSEPAQPETDGEIGMARAEFWAPLWSFPATLPEVRALFQRGLAKLGGRPAQAPHEFAVAVFNAGVDSGVPEFARYELRQTTSSQVFEAIPREQIHSLSKDRLGPPVSSLLVQLIESGWLDRLPFEPRDSKQKGKFVGLRGPIESAIVRTSERPDPERWQQLLLRLATAQTRIDRNKDLRKRCKPIPPLSSEWFYLAWPTPPAEIAIARAIASVGWHVALSSIPLQANVYGVTLGSRHREWRASFPEVRPAQAVWGSGNPLQTLLDVAQRRLIDAEGLPRTPFAGTRHCSSETIQQFLGSDGSIDLDEIAKWVPALALIDWSAVSGRPAVEQGNEPYGSADGTVMIHGLIRPLFHCDREQNLFLEGDAPLFRPHQRPRANLLLRVFHLLRFGALDEAFQVVRDRYLAVGRAIVMPPEGLVANGEAIAASLLIPASDRDVANGLKRWLQPVRNR